jgi:hypothetical protein
MTPAETPSLRAALATALAGATKQRDRAAVKTYRSAMAAIDNAEAVPLTDRHRAAASEGSAVGIGRGDVQRRALSDADVRAVLQAEIDEARAAADALHERDAAAAGRLREAARLLGQLISSAQVRP